MLYVSSAIFPVAILILAFQKAHMDCSTVSITILIKQGNWSLHSPLHFGILFSCKWKGLKLFLWPFLLSFPPYLFSVLFYIFVRKFSAYNLPSYSTILFTNIFLSPCRSLLFLLCCLTFCKLIRFLFILFYNNALPYTEVSYFPFHPFFHCFTIALVGTYFFSNHGGL